MGTAFVWLARQHRGQGGGTRGGLHGFVPGLAGGGCRHDVVVDNLIVVGSMVLECREGQVRVKNALRYEKGIIEADGSRRQ